jgi:phosphoserine phosphatase
VAGYDVAGRSVPADETGGDSFDVIPQRDGTLMLLLGDATGHGIGPALSVTQVRAMLRVASRLGAGLDDALMHINDQLADDLSSNRFVTAFLGVVDPRTHRVTHHSAGQGPLLHFHAGSGECEWFGSSRMALGLFAGLPVKGAKSLDLSPGDILGLMTDGVFEQEDAAQQQFGQERVAEIVRRHRGRPMGELLESILSAVASHRGAVPQADDVTVLLVGRLPEGGG